MRKSFQLMTCAALALTALAACERHRDPDEPPLGPAPEDSGAVDDPVHPARIDVDQDGVPATIDCDDRDARIGRLLLEDEYLEIGEAPASPEFFSYPWDWAPSEGPHRAVLGPAAEWTDTVTLATLRAEYCDDCDDRLTRIGTLARAVPAPDTFTGYTGYRCGLAHNPDAGCYRDRTLLEIAKARPEGTAVQLAYAELTPEAMDGTPGALSFWAVGDKLACGYQNDEGRVAMVRTWDVDFASGTVGFNSVLTRGEFEDVRVCEALALP